MKNASLWALTGAALVVGLAYACAVPVDLKGCAVTSRETDCDIVLAQPYEFGPDASVGQGGNAGSGSMDPSGGSAGTSSPPPGGSAGNPPPGGGSAGQGQSGSAGNAGTAGAGGGSAGSGAAGAGGSAGSAGSAGTGSAGTSAAGAGGTGTQSNFSVDVCDFADRTGCEAFACATACTGNYCTTNCPPIIACVAAAPTCITEQDPMCGVAFQNPYRENECTPEVNSSGDSATAGTPAFVALRLVQCLCTPGRL